MACASVKVCNGLSFGSSANETSEKRKAMATIDTAHFRRAAQLGLSIETPHKQQRCQREDSAEVHEFVQKRRIDGKISLPPGKNSLLQALRSAMMQRIF